MRFPNQSRPCRLATPVIRGNLGAHRNAGNFPCIPEALTQHRDPLPTVSSDIQKGFGFVSVSTSGRVCIQAAQPAPRAEPAPGTSPGTVTLCDAAWHGGMPRGFDPM